MKLIPSLLGGLAGALTVSVLHEVLKKQTKDAPRLDKLGMQVISKGLRQTDGQVPPEKQLFRLAFGTEILLNTLYYSLAGIGKNTQATGKGTVLGALAGIGSIMLPKPLGLQEQYSNKSFRTRAMTMGLYLLGGYITSAVTKALDKPVTAH